jgi:hypothetical protein
MIWKRKRILNLVLLREDLEGLLDRKRPGKTKSNQPKSNQRRRRKNQKLKVSKTSRSGFNRISSLKLMRTGNPAASFLLVTKMLGNQQSVVKSCFKIT